MNKDNAQEPIIWPGLNKIYGLDIILNDEINEIIKKLGIKQSNINLDIVSDSFIDNFKYLNRAENECELMNDFHLFLKQLIEEHNAKEIEWRMFKINEGYDFNRKIFDGRKYFEMIALFSLKK